MAFAYKDKQDTTDVASEPQTRTVQRLMHQIERSGGFKLNVETEYTTDSARLLAFVLTQNAKCAVSLVELRPLLGASAACGDCAYPCAHSGVHPTQQRVTSAASWPHCGSACLQDATRSAC